MATTLITTPNLVSPLNDLYGNYYLLSNSLYTSTNFKYVVLLNATTAIRAATPSFMVQENLPPRPTTGYGLYSPYKSILSLISYDLNQNITGVTVSHNSMVEYNINYGFQYDPNISVSHFSGLGGNTKLTVASTASLLAGDIIYLQTQNVDISGISTIVSFSSGLPVINKALGASTIDTGVITNLQRIDGTSSNYFGFNGTRQYGNQNVNYYSSYTMGAFPLGLPSPVPFLTDYPHSLNNKKLLLSNQKETVSCLFDKTSAKLPNPPTVWFNFYDQSNNLIAGSDSPGSFTNIKDAIYSNSVDQVRFDIPIGTDVVSAFLSTYNPSYYTVEIFDSIGGTYSNILYYKVDTSCSVYSNVRVMWMNSFGAFDFFNFRLDDKKTYNINRNEYKKTLPVDYNIGDRQRTILSQTVVEQHVINTDWISESIYSFLGELLVSPEVYIINESTGSAYPVILMDPIFDYKTAIRDKIFQLSLTYQTSYDIETQQQ